jgi:hypothetical protein
LPPRRDEFSFAQPTSPPAPLVDSSEYNRRPYGYSPGKPVVDFPDNLSVTLDTYFALTPKKRIAFARAAELYGLASDVWASSQSLSLAVAALVFAIESVIHAEDPNPTRCPDCSALHGDEKCQTCGAPKYGLTRRFKDFVEQSAHNAEERDLAARLYEVRSAIAHRGQPLRIDEFDMGYHVGEKDDENAVLFGATPLPRRVLREWLSSQGSQ